MNTPDRRSASPASASHFDFAWRLDFSVDLFRMDQLGLAVSKRVTPTQRRPISALIVARPRWRTGFWRLPGHASLQGLQINPAGRGKESARKNPASRETPRPRQRTSKAARTAPGLGGRRNNRGAGRRPDAMGESAVDSRKTQKKTNRSSSKTMGMIRYVPSHSLPIHAANARVLAIDVQLERLLRSDHPSTLKQHAVLLF